jgi:hypothetical protein
MSSDVSPLFIGGVGGSGTRLICKLALDAGYFMGRNLNKSLDSLDLRPFYANYVREYLENEGSSDVQKKLKKIFLDYVSIHNNHNNSKWGAKNPRSILVLPLLHSIYPKMKFIHVIRDGRDMAFSKNQNQIKRYGDIFVKNIPQQESLYILEYWSIVNQKAFEYSISNLKDNYLLVRYEDALEKTKETTEVIFKFLGSSFTDFSTIPTIVKSSKTKERWKLHEKELSNITQFEIDVLKKFGYD